MLHPEELILSESILTITVDSCFLVLSTKV